MRAATACPPSTAATPSARRTAAAARSTRRARQTPDGERRQTSRARSRALEEARRARRGGARNGNPLDRTGPARAPLWRRLQLPASEDPGGTGLLRPNRKYLYGILAVLLVAAVVRSAVGGHDSSGHASLARSCTVAAFAIGGDTFDAAGSLPLTLTGPAHGSYAVYLDDAAVAGKVVTTSSQRSSATTVVAPRTLPGCYGQDTFALGGDLLSGRHELDLFRVAADGSETFVQQIGFTVR